MLNLNSLDVTAVAITAIVWCFILVALVVNARSGDRRFVSLLTGILTANTGALLGMISHMLKEPHSILLAADAVAVLLILSGLACILVDAVKYAHPQPGQRS